MALQPISGTALHVAIKPVGSYPAFSPLPPKEAVVFCYLNSTFADSFPLGSMVPQSVARTFLSIALATVRLSVIMAAKLAIFLATDKLSLIKVLILVKNCHLLVI